VTPTGTHSRDSSGRTYVVQVGVAQVGYVVVVLVAPGSGGGRIASAGGFALGAVAVRLREIVACGRSAERVG